MASEHANVATPSGAKSPTFTIQIISPSIGVPRGLSFPGLPPGTTISQLKAKIRESLDAKPSDQTQRLIHRGRLLARENQTLLETFGEEALRSTDSQTLHLVLRDLSDARPATTSAPPVTSQPTAPNPATVSAQQPQPLPYQHIHINHGQPQHPFFQAQPQVRPFVPNQLGLPPQAPVIGMTATGPNVNIPYGYHPQQVFQQQLHQQRQWAAAHAAQLEHQNRLQELINQSQRGRATTGLNGAQDQPAPNQRSASVPGTNAQGRTASPFQPDATRTVVREGVGPNGQQWRITVNESVSTPLGFQQNPRTGSPFSAADIQNFVRASNGTAQPRLVPSGADVQNILRTADAGQAATRVITDAMRRNASNPSLINLANNQANQPIPPGVTTPLNSSRAGTPTMADSRVPGQGSSAPSQPPASMFSGAPVVYILSSPEGPRALLINGNLGTYVSGPIQTTPNPPLPQRTFVYGTQFTTYQVPNAQLQHRTPMIPPPRHGVHPHPVQPQAQAPVAQGLPPLPQGQPGHPVAQPGHPQVHAIALAQVWPHVWMLIRLGLFIWWFTSPNSSWSRWLTVISIAMLLFLANTGLLNPIGQQIWVPVRRHIENLMPLADGHHRAPTGAENAANAGQQPLNPEDTAARLVRERQQANGNWLVNQARRLERAGILFLASIAPGVAEGHIAQMEAERQRRDEAAAVVEDARAQAERADSPEDNPAPDGNDPAPSGPEVERQPEPAVQAGGDGAINEGPQREGLVML